LAKRYELQVHLLSVLETTITATSKSTETSVITCFIITISNRDSALVT